MSSSSRSKLLPMGSFEAAQNKSIQMEREFESRKNKAERRKMILKAKRTARIAKLEMKKKSTSPDRKRELRKISDLYHSWAVKYSRKV